MALATSSNQPETQIISVNHLSSSETNSNQNYSNFILRGLKNILQAFKGCIPSCICNADSDIVLMKIELENVMKQRGLEIDAAVNYLDENSVSTFASSSPFNPTLNQILNASNFSQSSESSAIDHLESYYPFEAEAMKTPFPQEIFIPSKNSSNNTQKTSLTTKQVIIDVDKVSAQRFEALQKREFNKQNAPVKNSTDADKVKNSIDVDKVKNSIDIDKVKNSIDVDKVKNSIDIDTVKNSLDVDKVRNIIDIDTVENNIDVDILASTVNVDELASTVDVDQLASTVDVDELAKKQQNDSVSIISSSDASVQTQKTSNVKKNSHR